MDIVGYYADEALTGTNMDRSDFQRLLADAERDLFDVVVIYDLQRGSRDVADWFIFRKEMKRLGIRVISVNNRLGDIDNPEDFLNESISAVLGQHQVLQYRRDSIGGKKARARKGLFCGGVAPLGYDIEGDRYVINEREAPVIRMIFEMYASGRSYSEILREVWKTGVTGKSGRPIASNTLHYLLKNERYTGTFIWFEREERHMHKWVGRKNPEEDVTRIEGVIPQLVPREVWDIVRDRMRANKKNTTNNTRVGERYYLLSGLIRCGNCAGALAGFTTTSKNHQYKKYICINKRKAKACKAKDIRADKLEAYVLNLLRTQVLVPDYISALVDRVIAGASRDSEREQLKAEISGLDRKNNHLFTAIENGLSSVDSIARINENSARKKIIQERLSRLPAVGAVDHIAIQAILMADISRSLDTPAAQKEIIQRYIQSVTIYDEYIDLVVSPNFARYIGEGSNKKAGTNLLQLVPALGFGRTF